MQNNYKVYMHIFPNNKVYIGITKRKLNERWMNGYGYCHQNRVYSAIKKYGWQNVRHVILYDNLSYLEACEKEISDIELYKSSKRKFGYNNSIGGEKSALGFKHTKEAELDLNIGKGDITKVIKGKRKTAGGYNWEYAINKEWTNEK